MLYSLENITSHKPNITLHAKQMIMIFASCPFFCTFFVWNKTLISHKLLTNLIFCYNFIFVLMEGTINSDIKLDYFPVRAQKKESLWQSILPLLSLLDYSMFSHMRWYHDQVAKGSDIIQQLLQCLNWLVEATALLYSNLYYQSYIVFNLIVS